jgi:hypothetical protein
MHIPYTLTSQHATPVDMIKCYLLWHKVAALTNDADAEEALTKGEVLAQVCIVCSGV